MPPTAPATPHSHAPAPNKPGTPSTPPTGPATPAAPPTAPAAPAAPAKPELSLSDIGSAFTLPAEMAAEAAPVRSRSEKQQAMDDVVAAAHKVWASAGKPSATWPLLTEKGCVKTYFSLPELSAGLKQLINRAASFHGYRVRWGTPYLVTEKLIKQMGARNVAIPADYVGREVISFAILDKRERATSGGKPAADVVAEKTGTPESK